MQKRIRFSVWLVSGALTLSALLITLQIPRSDPRRSGDGADRVAPGRRAAARGPGATASRPPVSAAPDRARDAASSAGGTVEDWSAGRAGDPEAPAGRERRAGRGDERGVDVAPGIGPRERTRRSEDAARGPDDAISRAGGGPIPQDSSASTGAPESAAPESAGDLAEQAGPESALPVDEVPPALGELEAEAARVAQRLGLIDSFELEQRVQQLVPEDSVPPAWLDYAREIARRRILADAAAVEDLSRQQRPDAPYRPTRGREHWLGETLFDAYGPEFRERKLRGVAERLEQ